MSEQVFIDLLCEVASKIEGQELGAELELALNSAFGPGTEKFGVMSELCAQGEAEGWLMGREMGGIKFGRALKPGVLPGNLSVDVVRMKDVRGPHHIHTTGEIGALMPISGTPKFDGKPSGWYVYPSGSSHHPTVEGGDAYVLYFLPDGAIEFTGK